ncbi:ABC-three component system protein [Methanolobus sp. ZRKC5]|uniref:ABC-three component system protein n=1 Tax=unclassified Methanolobus TaxID=2629569 RepID=UPI00313A8747
MDINEKTIARHLFQNKILKADGQAFEDLFSAIMNYAEPDFQQIKPWGNIGDRKNDGYIKSKGIFFQVFAPEDIEKSYTSLVSKLKTDFAGLKTHWSPINEFYFVVNDKNKGVNPDSEKLIQEIKTSHKLKKAGFWTARKLENILFELEDDQILVITGFFPDPASIKYLDYSILAEVISHIMKLPLPKDDEPEIRYPDWDDKIEFNNLSEHVATYLNNGCIQLSSLNKYLKNNSDFLVDSLRDKMNEIYIQEKKDNSGDELFWAIINCASPRPEQIYQISVIVIMAKYFETCDIFEEPTQGEM